MWDFVSSRHCSSPALIITPYWFSLNDLSDSIAFQSDTYGTLFLSIQLWNDLHPDLVFFWLTHLCVCPRSKVIHSFESLRTLYFVAINNNNLWSYGNMAFSETESQTWISSFSSEPAPVCRILHLLLWSGNQDRINVLVLIHQMHFNETGTFNSK